MEEEQEKIIKNKLAYSSHMMRLYLTRWCRRWILSIKRLTKLNNRFLTSKPKVGSRECLSSLANAYRWVETHRPTPWKMLLTNPSIKRALAKITRQLWNHWFLRYKTTISQEILNHLAQSEKFLGKCSFSINKRLKRRIWRETDRLASARHKVTRLATSSRRAQLMHWIMFLYRSQWKV